MTGFDGQTLLIFALAAATLVGFIWMVWPAMDSRRWRFALDTSASGLIMGVIGVVLLVDMGGPIFAILIAFSVVVHEYGHVLAFRLAGHPDPRFRLAPFGGVAFSAQAQNSQAESAFIALMGPGFSLVLVLVATLMTLGLRAAGEYELAAHFGSLASLTALINALNLLPFFPLDGGVTLRSILSYFGVAVMRAATLFMSLVLAAIAVAVMEPLLMIFAGIGFMMALAVNAAPVTLPPMPAQIAGLATLAYAAVFAAHAWFAWPAMLGVLARLGFAI